MNKFTIFLVSLVWLLLAVGATYLAISWSKPVIFVLATAVPIGIFLLNHIKFVFMMAVATLYSGLVFPGLPATLSLHHLLVFFYILIVVLGTTLQKRHRSVPGYFYLLLAILANLLIVIYVRGSGFRALGDSNWGGARYLDIFLSIGLLLCSRFVVLSLREWRRFLLILLGMSLLPILAETIFLLSGGRVYLQYYFIRMNTATVAAYFQEAQGQELIRFQSGNRTGVILAIAAALLLYHNPRRKVLPALMVLAGILLVGFSGHRSGLLDLMLLCWMVGFYLSKKMRNLYIQATIAGGAAVMVVLFFAGPFLPLPFQRALTFIPGIEWSPEALRSASETWDWRLNVWSEGLRELKMNPGYFLIGKGYTYSGAEYEALMIGNPGEYNYWFAVILSTYHQGALSLLIGMGIPGLLLFTLFLVFAIGRHVKFARSPWGDALLQKAHKIFLTYFVILAVKFYLIYGDLFISLPTFVIWLVLLEALVVTSEKISEAQSREISQVDKLEMNSVKLPSRFVVPV